eukprot:8607388-Lingulodinium_polyedra.AAC.1
MAFWSTSMGPSGHGLSSACNSQSNSTTLDESLIGNSISTGRKRQALSPDRKSASSFHGWPTCPF